MHEEHVHMRVEGNSRNVVGQISLTKNQPQSLKKKKKELATRHTHTDDAVGRGAAQGGAALARARAGRHGERSALLEYR